GKEGAPTVLFFSGCGINYMYPDSGAALIKALQFLGVTILIPEEQACCGLPAVSAGATDTVERLAAINLEMFGKHRYDTIVTACASCHSGLRQVFFHLIGFPPLKESGVMS
ncbi:MAG: heterodisulfide reductase-related iron-sulfur binding cluster, partial [Clostridia bacterium]